MEMTGTTRIPRETDVARVWRGGRTRNAAGQCKRILLYNVVIVVPPVTKGNPQATSFESHSPPHTSYDIHSHSATCIYSLI